MTTPVLNELQIVCPKCKSTIKLTESLAGPLIARTGKQFEQRLADKQSEFAKRETELRKAQTIFKKARNTIDYEVAEKIEAERRSIALTKAKKARLAVSADLKNGTRSLPVCKTI